jgi:hypothetical protein
MADFTPFGNPIGDYNPGQENSTPTDQPAADGTFFDRLLGKVREYTPEVADTIGSNLGGMLTDQSISDNTLGQSRYDFGRNVFPSDLGSNASFNGHYMVININVQESSNMTGLSGDFASTVLPNEYSKVDTLRFNLDRNFISGSNQSNSEYSTRFLRPRFTRRIAESIAIYMPSAQLEFSDVHKFEEVSITSFGAPVAKFVAAGPLAFLGGLVGGAGGAAAGAALAGNIVDATGAAIGNVAKLGGAPINPKVEVIYSNTAQRQFRFDFLMSPSNQKESESIESIIRVLRFHAAPELRNGAFSSFFWIPPSEFDITFYNRGTENTKIPRINTCVLEQVDVSYAPSGAYSTFHNGYPVQVRMQLTFRETEVLHKKRITDGF